MKAYLFFDTARPEGASYDLLTEATTKPNVYVR